MRLREDIQEFLESIKEDVTVVAATKYVGPLEMRDLYQAGVTNFGENRVEAFLEKYESLKDIHPTWHFIGHLQRNKAKKVVNKIEYLHSLDSLELAKLIDKERATPLQCFVEVSVNLEENKDGVPYQELEAFLREVLNYKNVKVVGFMMMAIKGEEEDSLLRQFRKLAELRKEMEEIFKISIPYLSMGMSEDYPEAIEAGATHIRLGRILWTN